MDPVVKQALDEMVKRFDDRFDEMEARSADRWAKLDRHLHEASGELEERDLAVDGHLESLEQFASSQYTATVVADNWGGHFEDRVSELEHRMVDLELIRVVECRDERDARVEQLEAVADTFAEWRPVIDANIDDIHFELRRL